MADNGSVTEVWYWVYPPEKVAGAKRPCAAFRSQVQAERYLIGRADMGRDFTIAPMPIAYSGEACRR